MWNEEESPVTDQECRVMLEVIERPMNCRIFSELKDWPITC